MTDTAASSPLSELSEPGTPVVTAPEPSESTASLASSQINDSAPPIASTSTIASQVDSVVKKSPAKIPRKNGKFTKKGTTNQSTLRERIGLIVPEEEPCPACRHLEGKNRKSKRKAETVWVECDKCETWFHWPCVSINSTDSPESIDKWFCQACLTASLSTATPLAISYKTTSTPIASTSSATSLSANIPNVRKSGRSTKSQIDYANLNEHLPASVDRWSHVISARTASGQIKPDRFERKKPSDLTLDWIYGEEGMLEPFVVESPEGLGMSMPRRDITVGEIAELIGSQTPLEVIDCASQSSLSNWTLGQWAQYYSSPDRDKVRNVISLEVSETKLGKMVVAPELVRNLDWVDTIWPDDMKQPGQFPRVQKYCLMSVEKCWTDWHVDFAGSSVFYHVLKGGKTFYFIRPTPANLAAYERWSGSTEKQEQEWLGDSCDEVLKIELKEGNTAFLPTGWIHAVYTPADSIVIGGNFLHSLNIPTQLRIYEIELATKVPKKFRYPHFVKLLWLVAIHYNYHLSRMTLPPTPDSPLPATLSPRVLEGLFALSAFLINQTTRFLKSPSISAERRRIARENVPWNKVADPVTLTRDFRKMVLRAMGKEFDADCFKPHAVEEDDGATTPAVVNGANGVLNGKKGAIKRKGTEDLSPPAPKTARIKLASTAAGNVGSPPPSHGLTNQGEIIARQAIPVPPTTRFEPRIDPKKPEIGAIPAEVKETRNSQIVVRRWEENGETYVETRIVHTIIDRAKWSDVKTENGSTSSYQPYVVTPPLYPSYPNGHQAAYGGQFPPQPPIYPYPPPPAQQHLDASSSQPPVYPSYPYYSHLAPNGSAPPNSGISPYPPPPPTYPPLPPPPPIPSFTTLSHSSQPLGGNAPTPNTLNHPMVNGNS
ncbi:[Histone H3]-lysine-36 demethylase [Sporobolomyces salmoneus]|uniref:[Histone H3]-lysine-36 demethylase n=1 Tax=Sporobolomyces salmoneus TaxID=183962 RepID=UPI003180D3CB